MILPYGDQNQAGDNSSRTLGFSAPAAKAKGYGQKEPVKKAAKVIPFKTLPFNIKALWSATVNAVLPKKGAALLTVDEPPTPQGNPAADALMAQLLTSQTKYAIISVTLKKYVDGLPVIFEADRTKKEKDLELFTARLRLWPILNEIFRYACNEKAATGGDVANDINKLLVAALQWLPQDGSKACSDARAYAQLLKPQVQAIKDLETKLFKAQAQTENGKGGYQFKIHELSSGTEQIGWFGPVAVRARVAGKDTRKNIDPNAPPSFANSGQSISKNKGNVYPIPDMWQWKVDDPDHNPDVVNIGGQGLADMLPFAAYDYYGMNAPDLRFAWDNTRPVLGWDSFYANRHSQWIKYTYGKCTSQIMGFLNAQWKRLTGKVFHDASAPAADPFTFGDLIVAGLALDPEWGTGTYQTPHVVADNYDVMANIRSAQDSYRVVLKTAGKFDPKTGEKISDGGACWEVDRAVGILATTIAAISFFPPVMTDWVALDPHDNTKQESGCGLLSPVPDWPLWLYTVNNVTNGANITVNSFLNQNKTTSWNGKGPAFAEIIAALQDAASGAAPKTAFAKWIPGSGTALPWPLVYFWDVKLAAAAPDAAKYATAALVGLQPAELVFVDIRSECKSQILLAMENDEFGGGALDLTKEMLLTLRQLGEDLYGGTWVEPTGDDAKPENLVAYYKAWLDKALANPAPNSLKAKLDGLIAKYEALKATLLPTLGAAASSAIQQQMDALSSSIAALQAQMAKIVARRVDRRGQIDGSIFDKGGVKPFADDAHKQAAAAKAAKSMEVLGPDGKPIKVKVEPSAADNSAADAAAAKAAELIAEAQKAAAVVVATGDAIKELAGQSGLPVPPFTLFTVDSNSDKAKTILPPPPPAAKSNGLWLALAAAALLWAQSRK